MTREELIKKIALKMDEISSSDDVIVSVGTGDNNPLYAQINSLLNESVNDVLAKAPIYRVRKHIKQNEEAEAVTDPKTGRIYSRITVPADFLRLVSITDDAFDRPITELAFEGDETDKRQHNKFLVAKTSKPVAVWVHHELHKDIRCYSYGYEHEPHPELSYVTRFSASEGLSTDIDLDEYIVDIVSWVCAGNVFLAQGAADRAKVCNDNAAELMV